MATVRRQAGRLTSKHRLGSGMPSLNRRVYRRSMRQCRAVLCIACGQLRSQACSTSRIRTACPCCAGGGRATQRWRSTPAWSPAAAPSGVHAAMAGRPSHRTTCAAGHDTYSAGGESTHRRTVGVVTFIDRLTVSVIHSIGAGSAQLQPLRAAIAATCSYSRYVQTDAVQLPTKVSVTVRSPSGRR